MKFTVSKIKAKYHVIVWKGAEAIAAYTVNHKSDVSALRKHFSCI